MHECLKYDHMVEHMVENETLIWTRPVQTVKISQRMHGNNVHNWQLNCNGSAKSGKRAFRVGRVGCEPKSSLLLYNSTMHFSRSHFLWYTDGLSL